MHGAAFTSEVGDETGSFIGNMAIGTSGSGEAVDRVMTSATLGIAAMGSGCKESGSRSKTTSPPEMPAAHSPYFARSLGHKQFKSANLSDPSIAEGAETINVGKMPVAGFANNVGYASGAGLEAWYLMENDTAGRYSVIQNSAFWNNTIGIRIPYAHQTILDQLKVIYAGQVSSLCMALVRIR